jgi:dipeptidase E
VKLETSNKRVSCLQHHPVLGLREGSWLKVDGDQIIVKGEFSARLFKQNQIAEELEPELISVTSNKTKTITF